ncbi:MAG: hypothetical protein JWN04_1898 [Myxococcaceae bacterium]|nr:hypothetical protein [Myxococcaceae bacterium]
MRKTTSSTDRATSEVLQTGVSSYRVRLAGWFAPSWIVPFCSELAARQLSIDSAHLLRKLDQTWVAELDLTALPAADDPLAVSYIELAGASAAPAGMQAAPLRLARYSIEDPAEAGGTLHVTIEADDSLGLLGSMLAQLAVLSLFPMEMHIETRAGRAYDSFWLSAVGGSEPGPATRSSLERALKRACET